MENVPVTTYKAADGQTPDDVLPKFFRTEPNVAVIRDLVNAETVEHDVRRGLREPADDRHGPGEGLRRGPAAGVGPGRAAGPFCQGDLRRPGQRLVRKLCDSCKEAYAPRRKCCNSWAFPRAGSRRFIAPPTPNPDEPKEPCTVCGGIGYFGRTAIFELLVVGDAVRKVLASNPKLDVLRQAARKDGMNSLQEEGVLLVARGVTSLPELMQQC